MALTVINIIVGNGQPDLLDTTSGFLQMLRRIVAFLCFLELWSWPRDQANQARETQPLVDLLETWAYETLAQLPHCFWHPIENPEHFYLGSKRVWGQC